MVSRVNKAFTRAVKAVRGRIVGLLIVIIAYCLPVLSMTWYLQLHDELSVRIWLSVLVAVLPVLVLLSPPNSWTWRGVPFWFGIFLWLAVLLLAGRKFNLTFVSVNTVVVILALPLWWLVWLLTGRSLLLFASLLLGLAAMTGYWWAALSKNEDSLMLLSVPVLIVPVFGLVWAVLTGLSFHFAKRRKDHRICGPGLQALAMFFLLLPIVSVAAFVPRELELGPNWSAVSLAIAGILLGTVISEPLRRFLVELGELSPDPKPYQEEPQDFSGRKK